MSDILDRCFQLLERIDEDRDIEAVKPEWDELWRQTLAGGETVSFSDRELVASAGWTLAIIRERYQEAEQLIRLISANPKFATLDRTKQFSVKCHLAIVQFLSGDVEAAAQEYLNLLSLPPQLWERLVLRDSFVYCWTYARRSQCERNSTSQLLASIVSNPRFASLDPVVRFGVRCNQSRVLFLSGQAEAAVSLFEELLSASTGTEEPKLLRESVGLCFAQLRSTEAVPNGLLLIAHRIYRSITRTLSSDSDDRDVMYGVLAELLKQGTRR